MNIMKTVHKIYFYYDDSAGTGQVDGPMGLIEYFCNVVHMQTKLDVETYIGIYSGFWSCTARLGSHRYDVLDSPSLCVDHEVVPASANLPLDACNMVSRPRWNANPNKVPCDSIGRLYSFYLPFF